MLHSILFNVYVYIHSLYIYIVYVYYTVVRTNKGRTNKGQITFSEKLSDDF